MKAKRYYLIGIIILIFGLCASGASALSLVQLEDSIDSFDLVYLSDVPTDISAYQMVLHCEPGIRIVAAKGENAFQTFLGHPDENGDVKLAAFTTESSGGGKTRIVLAKIYAEGSGSITMSNIDMEDFSRNRLSLDSSTFARDVVAATTDYRSIESTVTPRETVSPVSTMPVSTVVKQPTISEPTTSVTQPSPSETHNVVPPTQPTATEITAQTSGITDTEAIATKTPQSLFVLIMAIVCCAYLLWRKK